MTQSVTRQDNIARHPPEPSSDSTAIIRVIERAALNPDVDIDKMERLLQMQERVLDRQSLMAYSSAMAAMQTELPSIAERGKGNNGHYATLEDIVDVKERRLTMDMALRQVTPLFKTASGCPWKEAVFMRHSLVMSMVYRLI